MSVNPPRTTAIITAYNAERYVSRAIESALNQSFGSVHVIVVDDGSSDQTSEVALSCGHSVELIRRIAQRRRNSQAILEHLNNDPQQSAGLLAQVGDLVEGLDSDGSARLLDQLSRRYYHPGQWRIAPETFPLLATHHTAHRHLKDNSRLLQWY